ncbi:MAG TPA: cyclic nucleotide-binding domain-containing protein [Anaerolineae bacterium]|nr:cyclic nucleotide-binding domain-containing protein [Anaerolineae bacterium]HQK14230.1 cyclic nucleotide-binding domain-containing protein [Anaerolineae bacterium]
MEITPAVLRTLDLFMGLSEEQLAVLAKIGRVSVFHRGDVVLRAGEQSINVYVVLKGQVEVVSELAENTTSLVILGAGQTFGEMSLLDAGPRSATIRCISAEATLLTFDGGELLRFWEQESRVGYRMIFNIARDLAFKLRIRNLTTSVPNEVMKL